MYSFFTYLQPRAFAVHAAIKKYIVICKSRMLHFYNSNIYILYGITRIYLKILNFEHDLILAARYGVKQAFRLMKRILELFLPGSMQNNLKQKSTAEKRCFKI